VRSLRSKNNHVGIKASVNILKFWWKSALKIDRPILQYYGLEKLNYQIEQLPDNAGYLGFPVNCRTPILASNCIK
jgi:hypothetical protein